MEFVISGKSEEFKGKWLYDSYFLELEKLTITSLQVEYTQADLMSLIKNNYIFFTNIIFFTTNLKDNKEIEKNLIDLYKDSNQRIIQKNSDNVIFNLIFLNFLFTCLLKVSIDSIDLKDSIMNYCSFPEVKDENDSEPLLDDMQNSILYDISKDMNNLLDLAEISKNIKKKYSDKPDIVNFVEKLEHELFSCYLLEEKEKQYEELLKKQKEEAMIWSIKYTATMNEKQKTIQDYERKLKEMQAEINKLKQTSVTEINNKDLEKNNKKTE